MVDIVANPEWKSVRILERDEVALGGYGGNMNEQATALVARTEFLDREKADRSDIVQGQYSFSTLADFNAVKATLPPNSVIIIDEAGSNQGANTWNGTTLTKSTYDPLTQAKYYVDNNSSVKLANPVPTRINYDTVTRTLNFTSTIYVVKYKGRDDLKVPQTFTLDTNRGYRVEYNNATKDLRVVTDAQTSEDDWAIAAHIEVSDTGMFTTDFLYTVNGVSYVPPQMGKIVTSSPLTINLNTVSSLLECRGNGRIVADTVTVTTLVANIPLPTTNGIYKLVHNVHTASLDVVLTSTSPKMGDIYLATLVVSNLKYTLHGVDYYSIDGSVAASVESAIVDATTKANTAEANAKDYFNKNGVGILIPANSAVINYDTATRELSFTGSFYIVSNGITIASVTSNPILSLMRSDPHSVNPFRIEFDIATSSLVAVNYTASKSIGRLVVAVVYPAFAITSTNGFTSDFKYLINGVEAQRSENGSLITEDPTRINFDNANKKLILHSFVRVKSPTFTMNPNVTVEVPYPSGGTYKLVFNRETNGFLFVSTALGSTTELNRIELATVRFSATAVTSVYGIDNYTIDGSVVDPVEAAKVDFRKNGFAHLILAPSGSIDYNTETKELTFSGTIQVVTNNEITQTLAVPQVLTLTSTLPYRIEYDFDTNTLHAAIYSANRAANRIVLGSTTGSGGSFEAQGFPVTLNGRRVFQSHVGDLITSTATRINFNNVDKKLILSAAVIINSPVYWTTLSGVNLEVPYPAAGTRKLVFDISTKQLSFTPNSTVRVQDRIELAIVVVTDDGVTSVSGIENYTINGAIPSGSTAAASTTATLAASSASDINFDFENKKLIMPASRVRLNYDKTSLLITTDLELDFAETAGSSYWQKFIYNKETKVFSAKQFNSSLADNEVVFALIQPSTKSVFGVPDYHLDGKPTKVSISGAPTPHVYGDLRPKYIQPTLPEFKTTLDSYGSDFTKIYDLYDALVAAHPSYVAKELLGVDDFGNNMYSYTFTTAEVDNVTATSAKPKYIIFSGIHGGEKGGIYNTYNAMKQICERHTDDVHLEALKHGVKFIVVPICSPTSFVGGARKNGNGVDIARNFPTGWFLGSSPTSETYGGAAPADQGETKLLVALMEQHSDALCFASHHNFSANTQIAWVSARSNAQVNMCKSLLIGETIKAKKAYSWMPQTDDYYIGYVSMGSDGAGMEASHSTALGMFGATVEVGVVNPWEVGTPTYSSSFATISCQFFINYLLISLDSATKFIERKYEYYHG